MSSAGKTWKCKEGCTCKKHNPKRGPCSEETKQKISAANKGRRRGPPSQETRDLISEMRKRSWTPERRQLASEARMGKRGRGDAAGSYLDPEGYRYLTGIYTHPLSPSNGDLAEHRMVLYDKIGPGPHYCHWNCGKLLEWGGHKGIFTDHLDGNKLNNDPENLVPSCLRCNWGRSRVY